MNTEGEKLLLLRPLSLTKLEITPTFKKNQLIASKETEKEKEAAG